MTTNDLPFDIQNASKEVQEFYRKLIGTGATPLFVEMLALQKPPGVSGTDRTLMEGRYNNEQFNDMPQDHARGILSAAKHAGISTSGKYYCAGLADKRGPMDPAAWIDSVHDVKRVAAERNLTVTGAVKHKGHSVPRPLTQGLSDRLIRELMKEEKARKPTMKKGELREYVLHKYGRKPRPT